MIFNEIKCHVNTSLGLVGGCIPCIPPCVRAWMQCIGTTSLKEVIFEHNTICKNRPQSRQNFYKLDFTLFVVDVVTSSICASCSTYYLIMAFKINLKFCLF